MILCDKTFGIDRLIRLVSWILISFSILAVFMTTPREEGFAKTADEGYYFMYAMAVKEGGMAQFPVLLQQHLSDKVAQLFPHPGRIGYVLLTAGWLSIFPDTFLSLARLSWFCFVLFLFVSFWFSRKYFGERTASFYTVLLSIHPLLMTAGRRVLQDSMLNLFWALSIWFFLDFLMEKKRRQYALFLLFFCISLSIKEASAILWAFFACAFVLFREKNDPRLTGRHLLGIFLVPVSVLGLLYLWLLGGWANGLALVRYLIGVHFPAAGAVTNAYSLFGMGPWYKFIMDDLMLSPWTVLLAVGYLFHIMLNRRAAKPVTYLALFLVFLYGVMSAMKYTKIIRFVMSMEITVCLFAVLMLEEIFAAEKKDERRALFVFLSVCVIYLVNSINFVHLFVRWNIYDPISYWLLQAQKVIPPRSLF
ncbi:membrane protein containing Glycosyl transferase [Candidatus Velamenicoccus archaeovorus]|uniref:Membrane protein containing Glycosyl transferase n=1 Tax=Velamenicoccus archaeovorus TaxID=1930593 RepID=A0A410P353_VELA1|nr:glycosyltransferase family 39 protein [Candidatus Velamenicoccus archaeovorus]QAT16625.1 membrane protein containing Glycosyl transferase [Candidatus Velamenicoccus archaeovorus]